MTQSELDKLLALVIAQARTIRIPVSPAIDPRVRLNCRARTRFGCCIRRGGAYTIEPGRGKRGLFSRCWPTRCSIPAMAAPTMASAGRATPGG